MTIADHVRRAEELLAQADVQIDRMNAGQPSPAGPSVDLLVAVAQAHVHLAEVLAAGVAGPA